MAFVFTDLNENTRKLMKDEVQLDISAGRLYLSPRLNLRGREHYASLLLGAIGTGGELALAASLRQGYLEALETRHRDGKTFSAKVPENAPEMLAEGEFNRFYIRALCLRATSEGKQLEIYRAKSVMQPRPDSQQKIGMMVSPTVLLADLRANPGVDTALGLPSGPNSGLSVRLK